MLKTVQCRDILHGTAVTAQPHQLRFRPAVYAIILQNDHVLLLPQWDGYDFPGGEVNLGETITEALHREVHEETGLLVQFQNVVDCKTDFFVDPFTQGLHHSIMVYCSCSAVGGALSTEGHDEHEKQYAKYPVWVEISKIRELKFHNPFDSTSLVHRARSLTGEIGNLGGHCFD